MKLNLQKIGQFYETDLGKYTKSKITNFLKLSIRGKKQLCITSLGGEFYRQFLQEKFDIVACHTPDNQPSDVYSLCWPASSQSANTVVLIHDIEFSKNPENHIAEAWRSLKGDGNLYIIFPNRAGMWARDDNNPFAFGAPSTVRQMIKLIGEKRFQIKKIDGLLFYPPKKPRINFFRELFEMTKGIFNLYPPGVIVIEAVKKETATIPDRLMDRASDTVKKVLSPKPSTTSNRSHK